MMDFETMEEDGKDEKVNPVTHYPNGKKRKRTEEQRE